MTEKNSVMTKYNSENQQLWYEVCQQLGLPDPKHWNIHKLLHGYTYAYLVIYVLNAVGIEQESNVIKAIAKIQKDLDHIMNDLNEFKNIMQALEGLDFPDGWDPSRHTDAENIAEMQDVIKNWMEYPTGWSYNGKKCSPGSALQSIWTDLFGKYDPKTGKCSGGMEAQLKTDLQNPAYNQWGSSQDVYNSLDNLNTDSLFGSDKSDWTNDNGKTLLDFLHGGSTDYSEFCQAFCHNYYNKTGTQPAEKDPDPGDDPTPDTKQYNAAIDDLTGNTDSSKNMLNGLNSTESSDLSMFSQNLTSMIQEGQQIIQSSGQETKSYVQNQAGR